MIGLSFGFSLIILTNLSFASFEVFSDVSSVHNNYDAIEYIQSKSIVEGYSDGTFKPDIFINRAEFTKIIVASIEENPTGSFCFPDVEGDWYAKYVCEAKELGIIEGYPDGKFYPAQNISFVEAAKIIVYGWGLDVYIDDIWYKPFVEELGDERAIPDSIESFDKDITRGEMTEIMYRLMTDAGDEKVTLTYDLLVQIDEITHGNEDLATKEKKRRDIVDFLPVGCFDWCDEGEIEEDESEDGEVEVEDVVESDNSEDEMQPEPHSILPACDNQTLTIPPVDLDLVSNITPLGNFNPPGHALPTDHMYFYMLDEGPDTVTLYAPGDIYMTSVWAHDVSVEGDYALTYHLCDQEWGIFGHVKGFSEEVQAIFADTECADWKENVENICSRETVAFVPAGTPLGFIYRGGTLDWGSYDNRYELDFVNKSRLGDPDSKPRALYTTCPLDPYVEQVKDDLYGKISRTKEPRCGAIMHDILGTLQGNWYYDGEIVDPKVAWGGDEHLSFTEYNTDPNQLAISAGGIFTDPRVLIFDPMDEGFTNRAFEDITPDGNIYCYEGWGLAGRYLAQMVSDTQISIEHQFEICDEEMVFVDPTSYSR